MPTGTAQSFGVLNYSGMLFNISDEQAPLVSMLPHRNTASVEFVINSQYAMGSPAQPEISETLSLVAPKAEYVTRTQKTNVVQIFHKTTAVSYAKQANNATLAGLNAAGQTNNVPNEFDFQMDVKTKEMRMDLEYTVVNGVYAKATSDSTVNKSRGIIEAITTNVIALPQEAPDKELNPNLLSDLMIRVRGAHGPTNNLVLLVHPFNRRQITNNWAKLPGFILPNSRNVGGFSIDTLITDFGTVGVMTHDLVPAGTAVLANLDVMEIVEMPTPGKGNFFWESLSKVGAGEHGQLFGIAGLDHGPEWYHGKITGLSSSVTPITKMAKDVASVKIKA